MNRQVFISINLDEFQKIIADTVREEVANSQPESQQGTPEYLTRKEVADFLKISLVTLNDWSKKGIVQSYRIGARVRYKRSEIDQALRATKNLKYRREGK